MGQLKGIAAVPVAVAVSLLASGLGCVGTSIDPPGPIRLHAQAANVSFESAFPAEIRLALGSTVSALDFSASANSDRGVWSARATLTREQVLAGLASVDVGSTGTALGSVQIGGSTLMLIVTKP